MLTFAYDHLQRLGEAEFEFLPNAPVPATGRSFVSLLAAYALMTPERFAIARVEDCAAADAPFVYPIELEFRFVDTYGPGTPPIVEGVSPQALDAVRRGRAVFLLFFGHEARSLAQSGEEGRSVFDLVLAFIRIHDLPPARVFFLSGNLAGDAEFQAWRARRGLADADAPQFRAVDFCAPLARQSHALQARGLEIAGGIGRDDWRTRLSVVPAAHSYEERYHTPERVRAELAAGRLRGRTYLNLNNQPRLHRQLVASWLGAAGLLGNGHVSFPRMDRDLNGAEGWPEGMAAERAAWFALHPHLPLTVDIGDPFAAIWAPNLNQFFVQPQLFPYDDSYVNVTSETFFFADDLLFLSEKTFKPLVYLQPFLLVGNAGSLQALRAMGFRTFGTIFDEGYDAIPDHGDRLHAVYAEAARVASLTPAAARDLYASVLPDLEHNFHRLVGGRFAFDAVIEEIAALVAEEA